MAYPNFKRGILWFCIFGGVAGVLCFFLCCWGSTLPAATDVSLCWAFRPWWRWSNWEASLITGFVIGLPCGIIMAFRPQIDMRRGKANP